MKSESGPGIRNQQEYAIKSPSLNEKIQTLGEKALGEHQQPSTPTTGRHHGQQQPGRAEQTKLF
jgi:hypothetical protein